MEAKQVLEISLSVGKMLLSNGAESYRVEETIERICTAYDMQCECMVTAKGVFLSIIDHNNEKVTSLKKVKTRAVDLARIDRLNSFSRSLQNDPISYEEAKEILKEIEVLPFFTLPVRIVAAGMTSFVYSLFFNGTIYDSIISTFISMGIYYMLYKVSRIGFFQFFQFFFSGFIIGILSLVAENVFPLVNRANVITGGIMILVPGVQLTNGIKDIIYDDFMSGIVKFGEAMLVVTAIGAGIATALTLGVGVKW
ncbi:threonine/serine exporter family protein [Clostridium sp. Marseille-Q2269]|uniref:threonine/serine exporter family protein n=1 Tax=Clostridium sp. Marseille-Q2269 TaxID=2942205 RepID=UPI002072A633|nr:threonine/serine exporter family protein [Clostridium sp. Marseille-Q2269]